MFSWFYRVLKAKHHSYSKYDENFLGQMLTLVDGVESFLRTLPVRWFCNVLLMRRQRHG
jgi:hypothetical protein